MGRIELPSVVYETTALPLSYIGIFIVTSTSVLLELSCLGLAVFGEASNNNILTKINQLINKNQTIRSGLFYFSYSFIRGIFPILSFNFLNLYHLFLNLYSRRPAFLVFFQIFLILTIFSR